MNTKHQKNTLAEKNNGSEKIGLLQQEAYQGPIPHPDLFAKFEEVLPGAADRILNMSELEQKHRHEIENSQISTFKFMSIGGLIFGFLITIIIIFSGVYLILKDKPTQGFILILGTVAVIVGSFAYKLHNDKEEAVDLSKNRKKY